MDPRTLAILVPIVAIIGAMTVAIVSVVSKAKTRQLEIRQRIAMIEKGLVPPPEVDPRGFERAMSWADRHSGGPSSGRQRRAGIKLMGVGFGLMLLMGFAGHSALRGIGIGGFLVVMGLALLINSLFENRDHPASPTPSSSPQPPISPAGS